MLMYISMKLYSGGAKKLWTRVNSRFKFQAGGTLPKGQIISKRFFSGRGFSQKTNENTLHTSKNEFIRSFFGRNR